MSTVVTILFFEADDLSNCGQDADGMLLQLSGIYMLRVSAKMWAERANAQLRLAPYGVEA
jgi:hypothetical protein